MANGLSPFGLAHFHVFGCRQNRVVNAVIDCSNSRPDRGWRDRGISSPRRFQYDHIRTVQHTLSQASNPPLDS